MSAGEGRSAGSVALAFLAGAAAFVLSTSLESRILWFARVEPGRFEWISDLILSMAVVCVTYLWLHLRASRLVLATLERQQIALDNELRLAADIQRGLLPELPAATPGFEWAARMEAARTVGGDFYDFVPQPDGSVLVILGDVSGKGIPAALIQASLKTLFRAVVRESAAPVAIAERVAEMLYAQNGGAMYATAIVARFDPRPARLEFVSAGHPAGVLVTEGRVRELTAGGPPLGLLPGARFDSEAVSLAEGELGVFATDGITEALEGLSRRLADPLRESAAGETPRALVERLFALAATSPGPVGVVDWQDDRTALAFRATATTPPR